MMMIMMMTKNLMAGWRCVGHEDWTPESRLHFNRAELGTIQGGITCGAIDEPRKSLKAIDERVIINFRDKNVVIARFRDKNVYR